MKKSTKKPITLIISIILGIIILGGGALGYFYFSQEELKTEPRVDIKNDIQKKSDKNIVIENSIQIIDGIAEDGLDLNEILIMYNGTPTQSQEATIILFSEENLGTVEWTVVSQPQESRLVLYKTSDNKGIRFTASEVGSYKLTARSVSNNTKKSTSFFISPEFAFDPSKIEGNDGSAPIDEIIGIITNQSWVYAPSLSESKIRGIVARYKSLGVLGYDPTLGLLIEYNENDITVLEDIEELKLEKGVSGVYNRLYEGENAIRMLLKNTPGSSIN